MQRTGNSSGSSNSYAFRFSLFVSFSLLLVRLLQWSVPFPWILLVLFLQVGLLCLFGVAGIWSIVHGLRQFKRRKFSALIPVAMNAIVLALLLYFPFLDVWLRLNFFVMQSARQDVVSLVQSGQLKPANLGQIDLPPSYRLTSDGGQIQLENKDILFYTFRGIDNYAGFMYVATHQVPHSGEIRFDGKIVEVEKFDHQWFWISAT